MSQAIPRGIEVLVKKASVDAAFKALLLADCPTAAARIGLELDAAEAALLRAVPQDQLEAIIERASVPEEHRRTFLGQAAAAMLTVLGLTAPLAVAETPHPSQGIPPDRPKLPPNWRPPTTEEQVAMYLAEILGLDRNKYGRDKAKDNKELLGKKLVKDLGATEEQLRSLHGTLQIAFGLELPDVAFYRQQTGKEVADYIDSRRKAAKRPLTVEEQVIGVIAGELQFSGQTILADDGVRKEFLQGNMAKKWGAKPENLARIRVALEQKFNLVVAEAKFKQAETVKQVVELLEGLVKAVQPPSPAVSRGSRPGTPPLGEKGASQ